MKLAKNKNTSKDILYYLAENDAAEKVRLAVIKNDAIPPHVTPILAQDPSQDVRLALAGRLVTLLPDASRDEQSQLYAFVVQALGTLALDEVLKIRKALSSALKDHALTPPKVAGQLARDMERKVSEPILRFCATLSDEDLLDILKNHPASWVVDAIAARDDVSEQVSEAVIESKDRPAGVTLISNESAKLTESLLSYIVEKARSFPEWQKPMALRKSLPGSVAKTLAEFVDSSVRDILLARSDFDADLTEEIAGIVRRRIELVANNEKDLPIEERLKRALKAGKLDEALITDAIGMRDTALAFGAIAHLAGTTISIVEAVIDSRAAKSILALTWKAGLSMRLALQLQKDVAHVRHKDLIYPKDGSDYPITPEDMALQLEFLGVG